LVVLAAMALAITGCRSWLPAIARASMRLFGPEALALVPGAGANASGLDRLSLIEGRNSVWYCAEWAPENMRRNTANAYCALPLAGQEDMVRFFFEALITAGISRP
jgi:hypothetical protein